MANPYLKRGSSNRGSKQTEERGLKKFWKKHKAIIIGTSIAVISIPVGLAVWRKMSSKSDQPVLPQNQLPASANLEFASVSADKKNDTEIIDAMLIDDEEGSKMEMVMEEDLTMPDIPDNPRAKITFTAADFE